MTFNCQRKITPLRESKKILTFERTVDRLCLEPGLGVEQDLFKSIVFYKKAMFQTDPLGADHYAISLHFGSGCGENVDTAVDH
jgi:hypothetical protein